MTEFERELKNALKIEDPPPGFADRILGLIADEGREAQVRYLKPRFWQWRLAFPAATVTACILLIVAAFVWFGTRTAPVEQVASTVVDHGLTGKTVMPTGDSELNDAGPKVGPSDHVRRPFRRMATVRRRPAASILRPHLVARLAKQNHSMVERNKKDLIAALFVISDELKKLKSRF